MHGDALKIGISQDAIQRGAGRGFLVAIGQLYGIVGPSLIFAEHVFRGLKRDMYVRGDSRADVKKLAITWTQNRDAAWVGDEITGGIEYRDSEPNRVFVVYASPNEMLGKFPSVFAWAEHWTWLPADPRLRGAPIGYDERFEEQIWIKPDLN